MQRSYCRFIAGIFTLILLANTAFASGIHVPLDSPIYGYLHRLSTQGLLPYYLDKTRPLTRGYVAEQLMKLDQDRSDLSRVDRELLDEYLADYRLELTDKRYYKLTKTGNTYFWFSNWKTFQDGVSDLFHYTPNQEKLHLMAFENGQETVWFDWIEKTRYEMKNSLGRMFFQHGFRLSVQIGEHFSAYSEGNQYSYTYRTGFQEVVPEYKGGFFQSHNDLVGSGYSSFDYAHAYIQYTSILGRIKLGIQPLYWGDSQHSLILSNNVPSFPFISWDKLIGKSRFSFFHGKIQPAEATVNDPKTESKIYAPKYLVGHRWEISFSRKLRGAFTEMLTYGDRDPELVYFIPTVFLWPIQHSLTDKNQDNILWFFEGEYKPFNGVRLYGTFLMDELRISEMFNDWAGNRWAVQAGIQYTPHLTKYSTDLIAEFTAVRPWTYTHRVPLFGTYSHSGRNIGFYAGPNSQSIYLENRWWISRRQALSIGFQQLKHGVNPRKPSDPGYYPIGADVNESYLDRNPAFDEKTKWLMGNIQTTRLISLAWTYQLSNVLDSKIQYGYQLRRHSGDNYFSLQIGMDY